MRFGTLKYRIMSPSTKILLVPDKFKGGLTSSEAAEALREGLSDGYSYYSRFPEFDAALMADGGDGSCALYRDLTDGEEIFCEVNGPDGNITAASFVLAGKTAFIEMARAAGLAMLPDERRNPMFTTTVGVGQLILEAVRLGADEIVLGIGGSATNDCGTGMLQALGFRFVTEQCGSGGEAGDAQPGYVPGYASGCMPDYMTGGKLGGIRGVSCPFGPGAGMPVSAEPGRRVRFKVVCDVESPLLGEYGAARCFAPQKGASPEEVAELERGTENFLSVLGDGARKAAETPGAGAAGGLGFALIYFLGAERVPGFGYFGSLQNLDERIGKADLIVGAEGRIDRESLRGKVIGGLLRSAASWNRRDGACRSVWLFCGKSEIGREDAESLKTIVGGDVRIYELSDIEPDIKARMKIERKLLRQLAYCAVLESEMAG